MSEFLPLTRLDLAAESAALRERSAVAFDAIHSLSVGRGEYLSALKAVNQLQARCSFLTHELALRNVRLAEPIERPIERPISGDFIEYCIAVEAASCAHAASLTT